jgi:hypothetical protein
MYTATYVWQEYCADREGMRNHVNNFAHLKIP